MKKQEYDEIESNTYKGYRYKLLKLKYETNGTGIIMENGGFHYEIYMEKDGQWKGSIWLQGDKAARELVLKEIDKLSKAE